MKSSTISKKEYDAIHQWVRYHYGSAQLCENPKCKGKSKAFHWSLIQGKKYERKRENYWQLCASCHQTYDFTEDRREKLRKGQLGKRRTDEHKENIRKAKLGHKLSDKTKQKISQKLKGKPNRFRSQAVAQLDLDGNKIATFQTIKEASEKTKTARTSISMCLRGARQTANGYKWKALDDIKALISNKE